MTKITDKTSVPLFATLTASVILIPLLIKLVFWASEVQAKAERGDKAFMAAHQMDKRLDRIEIHLGTKPKNFKNVLDEPNEF